MFEASSSIEATATTVGAGIVLGGFIAGTIQRIAHPGWGRARDEARLVDAGYGGGWVAAGALGVELLLR